MLEKTWVTYLIYDSLILSTILSLIADLYDFNRIPQLVFNLLLMLEKTYVKWFYIYYFIDKKIFIS